MFPKNQKGNQLRPMTCTLLPLYIEYILQQQAAGCSSTYIQKLSRGELGVGDKAYVSDCVPLNLRCFFSNRKTAQENRYSKHLLAFKVSAS